MRVLSCFSHVQLFETPETIAPSLLCPWGFSRQEYLSGLSCPPPGDLPDPGIDPTSSVAPALAGGFFTTKATWQAQVYIYVYIHIYIGQIYR